VLFIGVVLTLIAASCGSDRAADSTTTRAPTTITVVIRGQATPIDAVAFWVDMLAIGSYEGADLVVKEDQVVLLIAVESYSAEVFEQLSKDGVDHAAFWSSFVGGFEAFTGAAITDVAVGAEHPFEFGGRSFVAVDLFSPRGDVEVIATEESGRWYVDVLATFGPSFSSLFNLWIERLPPEATAPRLALSQQSTSLAVARDRLDVTLDAAAVAELTLLLDRLAGQEPAE